MQIYNQWKAYQFIEFHLLISLCKAKRFLREVVNYKQRIGTCDHRVDNAFESMEKCGTTGRASQTVVSDLEGTLLRSKSPYPYFMLTAFEGGSPMRGFVLLLLWPLIWAMEVLVSEAASMQMLIFVSMVGLKEKDVEGVARAVLCRFYLEDMHPDATKVVLACGIKCVVTCSPRAMVEPFLKEYLGVELVLGSELHTWKGFCTGFLQGPGVLVKERKKHAVKRAFPHMVPHLGLGTHPISSSFLSLCKEGYLVSEKKVAAVPREEYTKPLIFHDGRLAIRPTPMASLFIYLWFPIGLVLSIMRLIAWKLLPAELSVPIGALLGVRVRIRGAPPLPDEESGGVLYVCTHRTLLDPIFLSLALRRRVAAVTYSLSRVSELLSSIKTVRLSRNRDEDAKTMKSMLKKGDLVICPEGTTCREPYLLRFSPLFAEITNDIVPSGMQVGMSLFHGTTARGCKGMDPFYYLMNPCPSYIVTILEPLPKEETCASGKSSHDVANHLQKEMGKVMGYQCTTLTRRDKYRALVDNDGLVVTDVHNKDLLISRIGSATCIGSSRILPSLWLSIFQFLSSKHNS